MFENPLLTQGLTKQDTILPKIQKMASMPQVEEVISWPCFTSLTAGWTNYSPYAMNQTFDTSVCQHKGFIILTEALLFPEV
jgi:hypothetical protein